MFIKIDFESLSPFIYVVIRDFIHYVNVNGQMAIDNDLINSFLVEYTKEWNGNGAYRAKEYFNNVTIYDIIHELLDQGWVKE